MTGRRTLLSRRSLLTAAAGGALLPMPAVAVPRTVKFTLAWLAEGAYAYVFVARDKGMMKARGIDLEVSRGFGSVASAQSIAEGRFDFGIVAAPALILAVAKGLPLIALATCDYDSTMGVGVLDSSPISKPQQLAGKKVASVPTSGEFPFLPAYAQKIGLDLKSVNLVHVDNKVLEQVLMQKQVDAITSFAFGSGAVMLSQGVPSRWFLYSAAGIPNDGQTIATTKKTLAADPALCEALVGGLLEGLAFTLTNPRESLELFQKAVPEMVLNPRAKELARIGLGMWQHGIDRPEARQHGLGWGDLQSYSGTTDLVMRYLMPPGAKRPDPEAIFTNRFAGKIKLTPAQWASVAQRVSEFDKYLGRYQA
ncbi:MAG TPA: ABC transporter substrate-binding protein [Stellaceae bacterium]|nr:ABC transporter substrate-binding protein [Stellaceae bacterium]